MPEWTFEGIDAQTSRLYNHLLLSALRARPTPAQSNFYVRGAAMTRSGRVVSGGNHEYGITRAIHCEETLVARALEEAGSDDPISIVAFACGTPGKGAAPCGNCRDVLRQYATPDAVILQGAEAGGAANATPLRAFFLDEFIESTPSGALTLAEEVAIGAAVDAAKRSYAVYTSPERVYGAAIVGGTPECTSVAPGGVETDVAYHPTLPLRNAISHLTYMGGNPSRLLAHLVIVAAIGHRPAVPYLERQHLKEFAERVSAAKGSNAPLPVWLVHAKEEGLVERLWVTDSNEWLPNPFWPGALWSAEALKNSIDRAR